MLNADVAVWRVMNLYGEDDQAWSMQPDSTKIEDDLGVFFWRKGWLNPKHRLFYVHVYSTA